MDQIYSKGKMIAFRFLRGTISGAVSTMVVIQFAGGNSFADVQAFISSLAVAGIVGGITGGLLALDKYFRA